MQGSDRFFKLRLKNEMTEANIEHRTGMESEFSQWAKELERLAQEGVKKEIAKHKAVGHPIFYTRIGVPIMELPDGRCFEYRVLEDGTRKIVREVPR